MIAIDTNVLVIFPVLNIFCFGIDVLLSCNWLAAESGKLSNL